MNVQSGGFLFEKSISFKAMVGFVLTVLTVFAHEYSLSKCLVIHLGDNYIRKDHLLKSFRELVTN